VLNTVANVGLVLDLFDRDHPEWGVTEVARQLDMPKSNAHALLVSLVKIGLLGRTSRNRYRLGWQLFVLSERMARTSDLKERSRPVMAELSGELRETVLLAVLERSRVLYIDRVEGSHPTVRLAGVRIGSTLPLYCTAVGKVFLADHPHADAVELLGGESFTARTAHTITSMPALLASLRRVRHEGLAFDIRETAPDACCVAAPIRDPTGRAAAALSVSIPAYRFDESAQLVGERLLEAAATISRSLLDADVRAVGVGAA